MLTLEQTTVSMTDSTDDAYLEVAPVAVRDSYTIYTTGTQLTELIAALQDPKSKSCPHVTCTVEKSSNGQYRVEAIVGTVDPDNIHSGDSKCSMDADGSPHMTTADQAAAFIDILDWMGISYTIGKAVQTLNTHPDDYVKSVIALSKAGITTNACYDSAVPHDISSQGDGDSSQPTLFGTKGQVYHVKDSDVQKACQALMPAGRTMHSNAKKAGKKHHHPHRVIQ